MFVRVKEILGSKNIKMNKTWFLSLKLHLFRKYLRYVVNSYNR